MSDIEARLREVEERHIKLTRYDEGLIKRERARAERAEAAIARVEELCDKWDMLTKGESPTTSSIRTALREPDRSKK